MTHYSYRLCNNFEASRRQRRQKQATDEAADDKAFDKTPSIKLLFGTPIDKLNLPVQEIHHLSAHGYVSSSFPQFTHLLFIPHCSIHSHYCSIDILQYRYSPVSHQQKSPLCSAIKTYQQAFHSTISVNIKQK